MPSNTDNLVRSTVMIENYNHNRKLGTGSGLLLYYMLEDTGRGNFAPVIVTNKHVVEGGDHIRYRLYFGPDSQTRTGISLTSAAVFHPDPEVDLCILPLPKEAIDKTTNHKHSFISSNDIINRADTENLNAIENVFMIGYPNGIMDQKSLYPISRRGITATPLYEDFDAKSDFMIDCACFPGSSGSPVFLLDQGYHIDKSNNMNIGTSRLKLLGFLYAGPVMNQEGQIVSQRPPLDLKNMVNVPLMMNLGICVKAYKLFDIYDEVKRIATS